MPREVYGREQVVRRDPLRVQGLGHEPARSRQGLPYDSVAVLGAARIAVAKALQHRTQAVARQRQRPKRRVDAVSTAQSARLSAKGSSQCVTNVVRGTSLWDRRDVHLALTTHGQHGSPSELPVHAELQLQARTREHVQVLRLKRPAIFVRIAFAHQPCTSAILFFCAIMSFERPSSH